LETKTSHFFFTTTPPQTQCKPRIAALNKEKERDTGNKLKPKLQEKIVSNQRTSSGEMPLKPAATQ
jgi:hypothetical protein